MDEQAVRQLVEAMQRLAESMDALRNEIAEDARTRAVDRMEDQALREVERTVGGSGGGQEVMSQILQEVQTISQAVETMGAR